MTAQTPLQLEVHGTSLSSHVEDILQDQLRKIVERHGRVIGCRVVIRAPNGHHRMGEPFAVSIRISLPGDVNVIAGPISDGRDPRHAEIAFAVNDAFRRVARQLRDRTRKARPVGKQKSDAITGLGRENDRHG